MVFKVFSQIKGVPLMFPLNNLGSGWKWGLADT